jgi:hypothetical protein
MASFSKFQRPAVPGRVRSISDRDLDMVEAILRYRFSPTSELARLVGGHEDVTQRRLRTFWERQLVNRFAFPKIPNHGEFIYYLDRRQSLELLVEHQRLTAIHPQMEEELPSQPRGRLRRSGGPGPAHEAWVLAAQPNDFPTALHAGDVRQEFPRPNAACLVASGCRTARPQSVRAGDQIAPDRRQQRLYMGRTGQATRLPVEPDALFSLHFSNRPAEQQVSHFCYEADRGSMPLADMLKKFRAYYHFIKRRQLHTQAFRVHPIRAVLIETTTEARARKLMELAQHLAVIGAGKRSALFWFIISPLFTAQTDTGNGQHVATYLLHPEIVLDRLWALPDLTMHGLEDGETFDKADVGKSV